MREIWSMVIFAGVAAVVSMPAGAGELKVPAEAGGFSDLSKTDGTLIRIPGVKSMKPKVIAPPPAPDETDVAAAGPDGVPEFKPGDVLPNKYMMLFDVSKYHLPRPKDGWVYFSVGPYIYRANLNSRTVLERMPQTAE